jgi:hypothetical protein
MTRTQSAPRSLMPAYSGALDTSAPLHHHNSESFAENTPRNKHAFETFGGCRFKAYKLESHASKHLGSKNIPCFSIQIASA